MTDVFSQLYLDMAERIHATMPEIALIDQYLGQDQSHLRPKLSYPAVLIDFDRATYSMLGGAGQFAEVQISVRLLFDNYASSAQSAPTETRVKALLIYNIEKKLVDILHNWQPPTAYTQPLVRISSSSQNRNDLGLKIRVLTFTTAWTETEHFVLRIRTSGFKKMERVDFGKILLGIKGGAGERRPVDYQRIVISETSFGK